MTAPNRSDALWSGIGGPLGNSISSRPCTCSAFVCQTPDDPIAAPSGFDLKVTFSMRLFSFIPVTLLFELPQCKNWLPFLKLHFRSLFPAVVFCLSSGCFLIFRRHLVISPNVPFPSPFGRCLSMVCFFPWCFQAHHGRGCGRTKTSKERRRKSPGSQCVLQEHGPGGLKPPLLGFSFKCAPPPPPGPIRLFL